MARYRRSNISGATYFFTVVTNRRQPILMQPDLRLALREAINHVREKLPFAIDARVLLPDHLHAIWTLAKDDADFGKRWGIIKAQVSRCCINMAEPLEARSESRIKRRENDFWQRRFWEHQIRDERDFERCVDYVHCNPVKHGLARCVNDWPYSTFHRYVKQGVYPEDWGDDPGAVIANGGE